MGKYDLDFLIMNEYYCTGCINLCSLVSNSCLLSHRHFCVIDIKIVDYQNHQNLDISLIAFYLSVYFGLEEYSTNKVPYE